VGDDAVVMTFLPSYAP